MKTNFCLKKTSICFMVFAVLFLPSIIPNSFAHLEQSSSGGVIAGKYFSYIGFEPRNPIPGEFTKMIFSVQDEQGNDLFNIQTMVEIYDVNEEKRIFLETWKNQKIGDFETNFAFEEPGTYQIVLSISEENTQKEHVTPPRQALSSTLDCNCTRALFNISISEYWDDVWSLLLVVIIVLPASIFGYAMLMNFKNKAKFQKKLSRQEILQYVIVFLAIAGGLVHLSIYVDHVPLRIEYGIFLLLAAITQIGFGVLFLSILFIDSNIMEKRFQDFNYHRFQAINLFGLVGSGVLLGLYTYAVSFIPPLSPENHPEEIELVGVIAKSLEISLMVIIAYIMIWAKKLKQISIK